MKFQLSENVNEFLTSLEESKRNVEVYRKHVLKKTIKRQGDSLGLDIINAIHTEQKSLNEIQKEKLANNREERLVNSKNIKPSRKNRKLMYDHDLELYDYLLHSKIISKHEEAADIHLRDFDGHDEGYVSNNYKYGKFNIHISTLNHLP